jgi:CheY-like chemotaxis protein
VLETAIEDKTRHSRLAALQFATQSQERENPKASAPKAGWLKPLASRSCRPRAPNGVSRLLASDDRVEQKRIRKVLEREDYLVVEALDGKSALQCLVAQNADEPSLVLLELKTQGMTAPEFPAIVRSYHRLRQIPVVALTTQPSSPEALAHGILPVGFSLSRMSWRCFTYSAACSKAPVFR